MRKLLLILFVTSITCIAIDRVTKTWAINHLSSLVQVSFMPGFLNLTLVTNTGAAFSFAKGNNLTLECISGLVVLSIVMWAISRSKQRSAKQFQPLELIGLGFLIGGALGNLWDRISLGYVIDFLDFAFINFPVFNVADICVDIGVVLLLLVSGL